MSTYSQEVLELKKEILTEISNELKNIINTKEPLADYKKQPVI